MLVEILVQMPCAEKVEGAWPGCLDCTFHCLVGISKDDSRVGTEELRELLKTQSNVSSFLRRSTEQARTCVVPVSSTYDRQPSFIPYLFVPCFVSYNNTAPPASFQRAMADFVTKKHPVQGPILSNFIIENKRWVYG